jgi:hypothetical protein
VLQADMTRFSRGFAPNDTLTQEVPGDTLTSAREWLGSLQQNLGLSGAQRLVETFERVEWAYDEFPELELEYPRSLLARQLAASAGGLVTQEAVPLLMFCTALDPSSRRFVSALLERMARAGHHQAIPGVARTLARNRDFSPGEITPVLDELRRQERLDVALALISEVLGRIDLAADQSGRELADLLTHIVLDADQGEVDSSAFAAVARSARSRVRRPALRPAENGHRQALLSLAQRVSAKLSPPPLSPPSPQSPPQLGWRSGRFRFTDFVEQWTVKSGMEVDWLPVMQLGDAGELVDGVVRSRPGKQGHIVYGPYFQLTPGEYHIRVCMDIGQLSRPPSRQIARVEAVLAQRIYLAHEDIGPEESRRGQHEFSFVITDAPTPASKRLVEVRVWTSGAVTISLSSITVKRVADPIISARARDRRS